MSSRNIKKIFGEKIKLVRKQKDLTQEELADKAGLHPTYIGQIERGKRNPSLENIYKIQKALKVDIGDIFP